MKKAILLGIVLLLGLGINYAAECQIQVIKPTASDSFTQEQAMTVTWRMKGKPTAMVKIQLVDQSGNVFVRAIAGGTANDGRHRWRIPADLNPASYRVKVIAMDCNGHGLSATFQITPKMSWQAPGYAMISSLKVNQQSPVDSCTNTQHRVSINLPQGIHIWVTATSVIQPVQYKYNVELTNPESGYDYPIYNGGWTQQAILNLNPTYDQILDTVFPNGVSGTQIPLSLQGRVNVKVKNGAQSEPPQSKEICIRLWL